MFLQRIFTVQEMVDLSFKGAGGLVPLATIMVLAFAIGTVCSADNLNTGAWVAGVVSSSIPIWLIPGLVFLVACAIAFSTGTSWGTFAIMIPIAVPIAVHINADPALGALSIPLIVAAALGGGVFGDHCSPISDTSVVSSMAACSDHIDHVRTQIPYALIAAALTFVIYVILGFTGAMS
jgi:Na+/H+ antiporter NhaC